MTTCEDCDSRIRTAHRRYETPPRCHTCFDPADAASTDDSVTTDYTSRSRPGLESIP